MWAYDLWRHDLWCASNHVVHWYDIDHVRRPHTNSPATTPPLSSCEGTGGGDVRFRGFSCMILPQLLPNNTRQ